MNAQDFLSELSIKVYEPPLSLLRDSGRHADLATPLSVLMLVIDFETEVSMNGVIDFIGNSPGRYATQTVQALSLMGCSQQSKVLSQILELASEAGMTHETIQNERAGLEPFTVTTFSDLHGDKWDSVTEAIYELEEQLELEAIWSNGEKFVEQHLQELLPTAREWYA